MGVECVALYPAGQPARDRVLHGEPGSTVPPPPPRHAGRPAGRQAGRQAVVPSCLTSSTDDILLHEDVVLEVGVLAKEQQDPAASTGKGDFLHLPTNRGHGAGVGGSRGAW